MKKIVSVFLIALLFIFATFCSCSASGSSVQNLLDTMNRNKLLLESASSSAEQEKYVRIQNTRKVNVRQGPSVDYAVIDEVSPNEVFKYLGQEGNWYKIQYNSRIQAYVSAKYSVLENGAGKVLQDLTNQGNSSAKSSTQKNSNTNKSSRKTCFVCNGNGRCKYCVAGKRYAGGNRMETCTFCWGSMLCNMCGGLGYTP